MIPWPHPAARSRPVSRASWRQWLRLSFVVHEVRERNRCAYSRSSRANRSEGCLPVPVRMLRPMYEQDVEPGEQAEVEDREFGVDRQHDSAPTRTELPIQGNDNRA